MKVLVLALNDWANTGWRFSKCLEKLHFKVTTFKQKLHHMRYPTQMKIHPLFRKKVTKKLPVPSIYIPELKEYFMKFDVLHFIASSFIDVGADLSKKFIVVNHGGSVFRSNHERISEFFNFFVDASVIQCPDLLNLGAKNEHLIYYPVDTDFIQPHFKMIDKNKLTIGHFPSSSIVKGTETILNVVDKFNNRFNYVGVRGVIGSMNIVPWMENLKRILQCDVIIETVNPLIKGKKYGEWGNTALESVAAGKIVITNTLSKDIYEKEYGKLPLLIANNSGELEDRLRELLSMSQKEMLLLRYEMRQWAEEQHSIKSTAKRLYDKIYCNF